MYITPPSQTLSERVFSMILLREVEEEDLNIVVIRFGGPLCHVAHSEQRLTNKQIGTNKLPY